MLLPEKGGRGGGSRRECNTNSHECGEGQIVLNLGNPFFPLHYFISSHYFISIIFHFSLLFLLASFIILIVIPLFCRLMAYLF